MRVCLDGLTHYPEGYGIVVAKGEIDMGIRWRAGEVRREGSGYRVNGERDHGFSQQRGVTVMARDLSGQPIIPELGPDDIWTRAKHAPSF